MLTVTRSYESRHHDHLSSHYPPVQKQRAPSARPRSPSHVRQPYTSNCSRRRWPPSPKVEEVKYEEEIPMRGVLDQKPMLIEAARSSAGDTDSDLSDFSDDTSEDEIAPASDSSRSDHAYTSKPKVKAGSISSQPHNVTQSRRPELESGAPEMQHRGRGRNAVPKIDTDLARSKSRAEPLPQLERARSPYASGPQERKPRSDRFSGEYLLSPDVMSPRKQYAQSPRSQSQFPVRDRDVTTTPRSDHKAGHSVQPTRPSLEKQRAQSYYVPQKADTEHGRKDTSHMQSPRTPIRPSMDRRASEMPYTQSSSTPPRYAQQNGATSHPERPPLDRRVSDKHYPSPPLSTSRDRPLPRRSNRHSDDSDSDHVSSRGSSGKTSPLTSSNPSTARPVYGRYHERRFSSELPLSPIHQATTSSGNQVPINLSSLVSGAAITHTLNSVMSEDRTASRRASPRPTPLASPNGSPKSSPYSSPPRTPPAETSQHPVNPISALQKDSPKSKPSSPLSSRSSLWTADTTSTSAAKYDDSKAQPPPLKSRRTAPLPAPRVDDVGNPSLLATPGITVRSPSPAQASRALPATSGAPHQIQTNFEPATSRDGSHPETLKIRPGGLASRPRAASSVDVRPQLSVKSASSLQPVESTAPPRSRSRARSPSLMSPDDRYKPSRQDSVETAADRSASSRPAMDAQSRPRARSRSYVPEKYQTATSALPSNHDSTTPTVDPRSSMSVPVPVSVARSRSAALQAAKPGPPVVPLPSLPICPRPQAITGKDDWSTLKYNDAFVICPDCRNNVFGSDSDHILQHRTVSSTRKTLCDLNNPWIRLACLLRGPDISLLSALSEITSKERSCPQDREAPRDWYRLEDPDHNGKHIVGFNACPHCVHSLETLFPAWRNVFYHSRSSNGHRDLKERFCSLRTNGLRFGDYLDMIVVSTQEAETKRKSPNTKTFCDLAKQMSTIEDCPKDAMFPRKAWHIHPHLPEFTICQECYEDVVYPLVKTGSPLAVKIDKKPHMFSDPTMEICCSLYSPRMRKVFREACEDDDYEHLRHTVLKRHMLQRDLLDTFKEQQRDPDDREVGGRLRDLLDKWKDKE